MKHLITLLSFIFLLTCLFDSESDKIIGDYESVWIDIPKTRRINKGEEILPAHVSEIEHHSSSIIAKQQYSLYQPVIFC